MTLPSAASVAGGHSTRFFFLHQGSQQAIVALLDTGGVSAPMNVASPNSLELKAKTNVITNPWHSRPLVGHYWSDHPDFAHLTDWVWETACGDMTSERRPGPQPKSGVKQQLRSLLLDLYLAWKEDPDLSLGVNMSANDWSPSSRYNGLGLSRKVPQLVHRMANAALIDLAPGSYSGEGVRGNRTTRIRAAEPLRKRFQAVTATRDDVWRAKQECIVLKEGDGEEARYREYDDTDETNRMRKELLAYNALISETFIDIPSLDEPWIIRRDAFGQEVRVPIDRYHQFTRRIFSRGTWTLNGRFYGPWWQLVGGDTRKTIFINDTPTVEVDFKGLHLAIIAAELQLKLDGDPYSLPELVVPGATTLPEQRRMIKGLVLIALNASTRVKAFASFREGAPTGSPFKKLTNDQLGAVLGAFIEHNPHLANYLGKDQGIRLMNVDGRIAELVLRYFTSRKIPVLCIHDSFIIDYTHVRKLKLIMQLAAKRVVGRSLPVESKGLGWDEAASSEWPDFVIQDFRSHTELPRCPGYLKRLTVWETASAKQVLPFTLSS